MPLPVPVQQLEDQVLADVTPPPTPKQMPLWGYIALAALGGGAIADRARAWLDVPSVEQVGKMIDTKLHPIAEAVSRIEMKLGTAASK